MGASNHGGNSTVNLGGSTTLRVNAINNGTGGRSNSVFLFDPIRVSPTLSVRNTDGTSPVSEWRVGQTVTFNATTWTDTVNLTGGTSDILTNALTIGTADIPGTQTGRGGTENATFIMGNGTLQTTTMVLGRISGNAASTITSTMAGNGTFTLDHATGLLKATTITLAENTTLAGGTATRSVSGTLNLTNGTIEATTIQRGVQTGGATATTAFNWTNGTLRNTSGADLLVDTLPVTLASGTHTFEATGTNSITLNATSPLGGTGGFVKTGTGTLVLNAPSTYAGTADVQQGTLAINNALPPAADFLVNASATLSLANLTLNYNPNTGRALDIDGNLIIAGPVKVSIPGNPQGTTAVLDHGSITGTGNLTSDYRNASFNSTATTTSMTVNPGLALTWTGTNGDAWDLKSTVNWKDGANNPETFHWWDAVSFDESGALTQPSVNLIGDLRPASVSVNSTTDYTFGGTGSLTGTFTLTKNGTSTLNLGGSHSFDGGISIQGGTLKPVGNQSLGANGQVITVASGATLDANGAMNADRDYEAVISGTGVGGLGAIVNTGADLTNGFGSLTLAADATIGGPGRWEVRPITPGTTVIDLDGHTLTKTGSNFVSFVDGSMTSAGTLNINEGTITMARMDVSGTGDINVNAGAALRFTNQSAGVVSKPINLSDGALELTGTNNFTLDSAVSVTGTGTINVSSGRVFSLSSAVTGTGALTKADAGQAILLADNTYAGITTVSAGTLQFGNLGTTGAPGSADIVNNGTLRFARIGNTTVANNISGTGSLIIGVAGLQTATEWDSITTLTGNNTFAGNITINSGGLRILNVSALGTGPKNIEANNGSNGRSQFYLDGTGGNITVPANIVFRTSANDANRPAIGNLAGNNVIEGTITLTSGGGDTVVKVDSGSLVLNGQITTSAPSVRILRLSGTNGTTGTVNGKLTNGNTPLGVIMQGTNTWTLTNSDSDYTGTTTVNSGTLLINGNQTAANGAVTVNTGGTLGGTGTVGGSTTANIGGTIAPGTSIGTLSTTAPVNIAGTLAVELNASTSDRLTVGGALDLDATTSVLAITELAAPSQPVYVIASYSGLNGTFGTITGMPSGYSIDYNYNNLNQIALVSGASSPFSTWINSFVSLTDPNDKLPGADPDEDGANNLMEFALNGDPTSGGNNGLSASLVQDATAPAGNELTLIIAARRGATFGAGPNGTRTATKDGVTYTIEGSPDLNFPGGNVSHAGASDTAPLATGLPSLVGEDWEYHTFSLDSSENLPNKGFLRAVVE